MATFGELAGLLLNPSENKGRFESYCNVLLRKALRLSHLESQRDKFPVESLRLCVCAHLCGASVKAAHRAYLSLTAGNSAAETQQISLENLITVWEQGWKPAAKLLGVDGEKTPQEGKSETGLFHGYHLLFVPSLLFSKRNASILLERVEAAGGHGKVYSTGGQGFKDIRSDFTDEQLSADVYVCADPAIMCKYADTKRMQMRYPKWVRDSLRDCRLKSPGLYQSNFDTQAHVSRSSPCQTLTKRCITDFRAEVEGQAGTPERKRRKIDQTVVEKTKVSSSFQQDSSAVVSPVRISDLSRVTDIDTEIEAQVEQIKRGRSRWACEVRTSFSGSDFPVNEKICELLGVVKESYETKKDHFRALGYQRAIAKIRTLAYEITTVDDVRALANERTVGQRIERKIMEVVMTGRLLQAETILQDCDGVAVRELCSVWGIGPVKAMHLVANGCKSVMELREQISTNPALLDKNQKIGLRLYEDLLIRIPRSQVAELEGFVRKIAKSVDQDLDITIAGSYLRGKKDCGDVDIMIHGPDRKLKLGFSRVKQIMKSKRVLTDDLVDGELKYFGIFRFPGRPHARIDLFAVSEEEYPFALLTYTGSAIFNRSMRAKARAVGYSLSHKGIQRVCRGKNGKTQTEPRIRVKNEREIFLLLDIPYVLPEARSIS